MRHTLLLPSAFLAFSCFAHGSSDGLPAVDFVEPTSFDLTGRIVNGTKAVRWQFPHQVSLKRSWSESHFCGGSIINVKMVLTAAHCLYIDGQPIQPWTILVVAGELKLNKVTETGQKRGVENIRIHPEFNLKTLQNDIAILELARPFKFTPEVHSAPLAAFHPVPNMVCQVSGWGYPAQDVRIVSNDLMYVDLPIRRMEECRELLVNVTAMLPGMFCAGYLEGGKDACQGDSGGPMVCNGILTGVVSGGKGCALPLTPGVYSNVFFYKDWISNGIYVEIAFNTGSYEFREFRNSGASEARSTLAAITMSLFVVLLSIAIRP